MNSRLPVVSFEALLADSADSKPLRETTNRTLLNDADVIYALQPGWTREVLIYGREKLRRIAASEVPEGARVLRIGLSDGARQLNSLLALVSETKGRHDYAGPEIAN